jgi:gluconolactonase
VYFLPADGRPLVRVAEDLEKPNGLVGTAKGQTLYVADIGAGKTYAYAVRAGGTLSGKRLFCGMGSDGMTIDAEGNLYLTGGEGVTVFNPEGQKLDRIAVPGEGWTSNVCFGGRDRRTLFVTAGSGLYAVRTRVRGVTPFVTA